MGLIVGDGTRVGVAVTGGVVVWLGVGVLEGREVKVLVGVIETVWVGFGCVKVGLIALGDCGAAAGAQPATSTTQTHKMIVFFAIVGEIHFARNSPRS